MRTDRLEQKTKVSAAIASIAVDEEAAATFDGLERHTRALSAPENARIDAVVAVVAEHEHLTRLHHVLLESPLPGRVQREVRRAAQELELDAPAERSLGAEVHVGTDVAARHVPAVDDWVAAPHLDLVSRQTDHALDQGGRARLERRSEHDHVAAFRHAVREPPRRPRKLQPIGTLVDGDAIAGE